ncbi:MAG: hypothetical protein HQM10_23360 [Candidatus Riflebacteria bacterium]|nr:hypothetical protein [Candidatus Riflebacteria bacterium]
MNRHNFRQRKGALMFLFLGAFGLLVVLSMSLFGRFRAHVQNVTFIDQGIIARYFLEAMSDDIIRQLKDQYEKKNGLFFDKTSEWLKSAGTSHDTDFKASQLGCTPGKLVKKLASNYAGSSRLMFEYDPDPKISFGEWKTLEPPDIFSMSANNKWPEKEGKISVESWASINGTKFRLKVSRRFKFALRLLPVLKDFAWYFDSLHEEQKSSSGEDADNLNVLPLDYGEITDNKIFPLSLSTFCEGIGAKILLNPDLNGRVFLGDEDNLMFLNMGGEIELPLRKGRFSDLYLIRRDHFDVPPEDSGDIFKPESLQLFKALSLESLSIFAKADDPNSLNRSIRSLKVNAINEQTNAPDPYTTATLFVLGFGSELSGNTANGLFSDNGWSLNTFLKNDPGLKYIQKSADSITMSSAIRPYGLSPDWRIVRGLSSSSALAKGGWQQILNSGTSLIPLRQIFGPLARRFMVLSYHNIGSVDGPLPYQTSSEYSPPELTKPGYSEEKYSFNPPGPGGKSNYTNYAKLMSRIVSGDFNRIREYTSQSVKFPDGFEGYELEPERKSLPRLRPRGSRDFKSPEGITFSQKGRFSLLKDYVSLSDTPDNALTGLKARITGYFKSGQEFLKRATRTDEKGARCFDASGISYVEGDLTLSEGINDKIFGGIVIVNGSLTLGNIHRGLKILSEAEIYKVASELKQSDFITFVVNPSKTNKITLTGDKYVGVQLVMLSPDNPTPLIPQNPFLFVGGLAISRPDVKRLTASLKKGDKETVLYYCPCMGTTPADLFFDVNSANISFEFGLQ